MDVSLLPFLVKKPQQIIGVTCISFSSRQCIPKKQIEGNITLSTTLELTVVQGVKSSFSLLTHVERITFFNTTFSCTMSVLTNKIGQIRYHYRHYSSLITFFSLLYMIFP